MPGKRSPRLGDAVKNEELISFPFIVTISTKDSFMHMKTLFLAALLVTGCIQPLLFAQSVSLRQHTPVSRQLSANSEMQQFELKLDSGWIASIQIDQQTVGIVALVKDPQDTLIQVIDDNGINHYETVMIEARKTGIYKVLVSWDFNAPQQGAYSIEWNIYEPLAASNSERAEQLMNAWFRKNAPGAAVTVLDNGKPVFTSARGLANSDSPISDKTVFDLASVSKQFTAFAIAMLEQEGKLAYSDNIRKYLPQLPDFGSVITIDHLIHHSSGLRDWDAMVALAGKTNADSLTLDQIVSLVSRQTALNFPAGQQSRYSNTNYNLLAAIIEKVTGQSFAKWTTEHIFQPLGMNATYWKPYASYKAKDMALPYRYANKKWEPMQEQIAAWGSSSLCSNLEDLQRWVNNFDSGWVGKEIINKIDTPGVLSNGTKTSYLFGNIRSKLYNKFPMLSHLGLVSGYRNSIARFPENKITVIYLSNGDDDANFGRATRLQELFLPSFRKRKPVFNQPDITAALKATRGEKHTADTLIKNLDAYKGTYHSADAQTDYTVDIIKGDLFLTHSLIGKILLLQTATNEFVTDKWFLRYIRFTTGEAGIITGFTVDSGSNTGIVFRKTK
jgi:CubicO group peptidase (beta-lactamase class C family)